MLHQKAVIRPSLIGLLDYYIVFLSSKWYTDIYRKEYMANALEEAPVTLPQPGLYDLYTAAVAATDPNAPEWSGGMRLGPFAQNLLNQRFDPIGLRVEVTRADAEYPIGDDILAPGIYRIASEPYIASLEDGQQSSPIIEITMEETGDQKYFISPDASIFTPFQTPKWMEIDFFKEPRFPSGWSIGMNAYAPFHDLDKDQDAVQRFLWLGNVPDIDVTTPEGRLLAAVYMARAKMSFGVNTAIGLPIDDKQIRMGGKRVPIVPDSHTIGLYVQYGQLTHTLIRQALDGIASEKELRDLYPDQFESLVQQALSTLPTQA